MPHTSMDYENYPAAVGHYWHAGGTRGGGLHDSAACLQSYWVANYERGHKVLIAIVLRGERGDIVGG